MTFLDLLLIMTEQQLRRHVLRIRTILTLLVIVLHRHIPLCHGVIPRSHTHHRVVRRMPLHARNLLLVPAEARDRRALQDPALARLRAARPRLPLPQVPHRPDAVVRA